MPIEFTLEESTPGPLFSEKQLEQIKETLLKNLIPILKQEISMGLIPSLSPKNFNGMALNHIKENKLPLTHENVKEISLDLYQTFIKNEDNLVIYDKETKTIAMHPIIKMCEEGDQFFQMVRTITNAVETQASKLEV